MKWGWYKFWDLLPLWIIPFIALLGWLISWLISLFLKVFG